MQRIPANHIEWRLSELTHRPIEVNNIGQCRYPENGNPIPFQLDKRNPRHPQGCYPRICIYQPLPGGKHKSRLYRVARLVAHAFLGPAPPDKPDVNHKSEDTLDNSIWLTKTGKVVKKRSNLEWSNPILNGLWSAGLHPGRYRLTPTLVRKIRTLRAKTGWGWRRIARQLGINSSCSGVLYKRNNWSWVDDA